MNTQLDFFTKRAYTIFESNELSEFLVITYQELGSAILNKNDLLVLTKDKLTHKKGKEIINEIKLIYGESSVYQIIKDSLLAILSRDKVMGQYFKIDYQNEEEMIFKVENVDIDLD